MKLLKRALFKIRSLFAPKPSPQSAEPASEASFPQFSRLPPEIRDEIWQLALEPRIIPIHFQNMWLIKYPTDQLRAAINASLLAATEEDNTPFLSISNGNGNGNGWNGWNWYRTLFIVNSPTCRVSTYESWMQPPRPSMEPLPALLRVCRESRAATIHLYPRCLHHEYDLLGRRAVRSPKNTYPNRSSDYLREAKSIHLRRLPHIPRLLVWL